MKSLIAVATLSVFLFNGSQVNKLCSGILPENDMYIAVGVKTGGGVTEADFHKVLDRVEAVYAPEFIKQGAVLIVERNWEDGTVNAFASQSGNEWTIAMFGGLARHSAVTVDGFAIVACHEAGHHIGGAPKYTWNDWASNEGESDYFATLKCMRAVFGADDNQKIISEMEISPFVQESCKSQHSDANEQALCIRLAYAGLSIGKLFADFSGGTAVGFETPDENKVDETEDSHPEAQCRLDTYFAGALCPKSVSEELSPTDPRPGSCFDNKFANRTHRPGCWFKL